MDFSDFINFLNHMQQIQQQQQMQQQYNPNAPTLQVCIMHDSDEYQIFKEGMCDLQTKGMNRYGHADLQITLNIPDEEKKAIISWIGYEMINNTIIVLDGIDVYKTVNGPYVRLKLMENNDHIPVWRIILPDPYGRMPEDSDIPVFKRQLESPYLEHPIQKQKPTHHFN